MRERIKEHKSDLQFARTETSVQSKTQILAERARVGPFIRQK